MNSEFAIQRRTLRERLRELRRRIPAAQRIAAADALAARLLALPMAPQSGYAAGYWAMDGEIALHAWQLKLPRPCVYCLPVLSEKGLKFAPWRSGDPLVTNRFGIPEPDVSSESLLDPDRMAMVVMPLVGFDREGHRLGMGGGWYDRSFSFRQKTPSPPLLVGAGFDLQRQDWIAPEAWDVDPDLICTELATYERRLPA